MSLSKKNNWKKPKNLLIVDNVSLLLSKTDFINDKLLLRLINATNVWILKLNIYILNEKVKEHQKWRNKLFVKIISRVHWKLRTLHVMEIHLRDKTYIVLILCREKISLVV